MANYVVGDIQGCFSGLQRVLAEASFNPSTDTLWSVGDLIARGEDSLGVLRYLYELGDSFQTVLGNHDLHFLAIQQGVKPPKKSDKLAPLLADSKVSVYSDWLRSKPLAMLINEQVLIAHAGLYPKWSFEDAVRLSNEVSSLLGAPDWRDLLVNMYGSEPHKWKPSLSGIKRHRFIINAFTRMRFLTARQELEFATKTAPMLLPSSSGLSPWFSFDNQALDSEQCVIFGHWAALMGQTDNPRFIGLDTGYVWGNTMTLYHLEKKEKVSVEYLKKK